MATMILDAELERELIAQRAAWGGDRFDEVWEGTYMMSPLADNEHQELQSRLAAAIQQCLGWNSAFRILCGANITDQQDDWTRNYRCPDVLVFSPNCQAKNCGTHWFGGPDFAVEITSPNDRSREKLDFYSKVSVRELLIIDRSIWKLGLYRNTGNQLTLAEESSLTTAGQTHSQVLGIALRLVAGPDRPRIEVTSQQSGQTWLV